GFFTDGESEACVSNAIEHPDRGGVVLAQQCDRLIQRPSEVLVEGFCPGCTVLRGALTVIGQSALQIARGTPGQDHVPVVGGTDLPNLVGGEGLAVSGDQPVVGGDTRNPDSAQVTVDEQGNDAATPEHAKPVGDGQLGWPRG